MTINSRFLKESNGPPQPVLVSDLDGAGIAKRFLHHLFGDGGRYCGSFEIDRLGTSKVAPLTVGGQINPALATNHIQVIKDTHGKTSDLSASDLDALIAYLKSLQKTATP